MPRHPPYALTSLIFKDRVFLSVNCVDSISRIFTLDKFISIVQFSRYNSFPQDFADLSPGIHIIHTFFFQVNMYFFSLISQTSIFYEVSSQEAPTYIKECWSLFLRYTTEKDGGLKWTRTTDLTLIRRAL